MLSPSRRSGRLGTESPGPTHAAFPSMTSQVVPVGHSVTVQGLDKPMTLATCMHVIHENQYLNVYTIIIQNLRKTCMQLQYVNVLTVYLAQEWFVLTSPLGRYKRLTHPVHHRLSKLE